MSTDFDMAMLATLMEDAIGKPCVVFQAFSRIVGVGFPTATCLSRDFGLNDRIPRAVVYSLCHRCEKKKQRSKAFLARVEAAVIASLRRNPRENLRTGLDSLPS